MTPDVAHEIEGIGGVLATSSTVASTTHKEHPATNWTVPSLDLASREEELLHC